MVLYVFYLCILAVSLFVIGRVLYIQYGWKPNPEIAGKLTQPVKPVILEPARGNILSDDGRPLALSFPRYQVYIDCGARQSEFAKLSAEDRADSIAAWKRKATRLSKGLEEAFAPTGRSAAWFEQKLWSSFDKGSRYLKLGKPIEKEQWDKLSTYPLAN